MSNVVVKLFTRPEIKGKRIWLEVNPKREYPDGTVFILRWLPRGAKNYSTKTLGARGLKWAQVMCASFEPPEESAEPKPAAPIPELGHNSAACPQSRMTSPLSWIASQIKTRAKVRPARAYDAHSAAGRPARKTDGLVTAGMNGTHSTPGASAQPVSTSGLKRNAYRAADGRRIRLGMRIQARKSSTDVLAW